MDGKSLLPENKGMRGNESNQLTEIRVCCDLPGRVGFTGIPVDNSLWHPDSPRNRQMLKIILESQNEIFGLGTHWVEEREAET